MGRFVQQDLTIFRHPQYRDIGAQTVARLFPELTATGDDGLMSLAYDKLTVPIIAAIAALKADNDSLRAELRRIRARGSDGRRRRVPH